MNWILDRYPLKSLAFNVPVQRYSKWKSLLVLVLLYENLMQIMLTSTGPLGKSSRLLGLDSDLAFSHPLNCGSHLVIPAKHTYRIMSNYPFDVQSLHLRLDDGIISVAFANWYACVLFTFTSDLSPIIMSSHMVNWSIDDTLGDAVTGTIPTYSPRNFWHEAGSCPGCAIHPDSNMTFCGTWHETTYRFNGNMDDVSLEFSFTGIDIFH